MDNLTHTLFGIALAQAGPAKRYGRGTTLTLAIVSNLPDIDAIWAFGNHLDSFLVRRMLTHSIVGIPLLAIGCAVVLRLLIRTLSFGQFLLLSLLGLVSHVGCDLLNSYGVELLYPFSRERFELAWIFIIDPFIWGLLLITVVFCWRLKQDHIRETAAKIGLTVFCLYLLVCAYGKQMTESLVRSAEKPNSNSALRVFPEVLGGHRFRAVVRDGTEYRVYLVRPFSRKVELRQTIGTDELAPDIQQVRRTALAQALESFFAAPVWQRRIRAADQNVEICVNDLRFSSLVLDRVTFTYCFDQSGNRL